MLILLVSKLSFLLRDFFKALIQKDFDIENGRPGSHVLGTHNVLWSPLEKDTIGISGPIRSRELGPSRSVPSSAPQRNSKAASDQWVTLSSNGKLRLVLGVGRGLRCRFFAIHYLNLR